ncbi:MAG TPA: serine/threonine-protein kinase, partial [Bryobacteraceae bacterium]|nr:serine/threonine-protein kinase [Bryobacteraceae bacterium]
QTVALKFLPAEWTSHEETLTRFRNEVRIARQISHPNVCRVYDIGEAESSTYLSMEYVDGEDLASLLRRIGRLPQDKALEIARQLCAGLAAAHDKGVLHRDLKPGNIMLDGQGQLRITDFGLAGVAGEVKDIRSGTPGYMAPEQRSGQEVTARSDIYALGIVLHEVFTGKRPSPDSSHPDLAPEVDRVIRRCLAEDPAKRPATALQVAAALPGGDPLAAALAAGETPSPEMVAAAGDTEGISLRTAAICLAWILVGLVAVVILDAKANVLQRTPFPYPPDILAQKARETIESFGYANPPADGAYAFSYDLAYQAYAEKQGNPSAYRDQVAKGQPPLILFWYRQSPLPLLVSSPFNYVSPKDPPPIVSGMIGLSLDPQGRLLQFDSMPPPVEENPSPSVLFDWKALFTAAGLDLTRFTPAQPQWNPLAPFDARAAWTGYYPSAPQIPMRIEAAAWRGKPVFFRLIGPWSKPERMPQSVDVAPGALVVLLVVLGLGAFLAWRNFRAKRGDIRGANRAAAFVFAGAWLSHLLTAHHVAALSEATLVLLSALDAAIPAATIWVLYLAFEPYVRRRWPQSMITWSRVLSGGIRDPLVGGHLLFGVALGVGLALLNSGGRVVLEHYGTISFVRANLLSYLDARGLTNSLLIWLVNAFLIGMLLTFILMLLRVFLRKEWLAAVAFVLFGASAAFGDPHHVIRAVGEISFFTLFAATLLRFGGLLPTIVCLFVGNTLGGLPIADLSTWYASTTVFVLVVFLSLTAYAFHTAVAGRPLFMASFLESD